MNEPDSPTTFTATDRRALASVAVQFFVNGAAFASFVPRLPEIRERVDVGLDGLGVAMTLGVTVGLVGSLRAPALIERFGTRRTLLWGGALMVAALPIIGMATTPIVLVVGLAAMSAADGLIDVSMNLQGSWLSARRHTPVMNRLHGLWSLGTVIGGVAAARAADAGLSLPVHLSIAAALMIGALLYVGAGLLAVDEDHDDEPTASPDGVAGRSTPSRAPLLALALSGAFAITVELVSSDWAAFRLAEDLGTTAGFAGLGFVAFTTGMTIGRLGGDQAVARLGGDVVFRLAILLSGIGLSIAAFAPSRWWVLAGYVVAGIGISVFFPKLYDDAARSKGRRGAGLAWLRTGASLTALVIPTAVGVLAASSLSVGQAVAIVALPSLVGLLAIRGTASLTQAGGPDPR
ncbi:MAG: MFS transporter [Actinomycetota bacterium]